MGSHDVTLAGNISNGAATTLNITKTGTGTLTLSGTNTEYTGSTTVEAGTLSLAKEGALSGKDTSDIYGSYTVNSGATLDFAFTDNGTVANTIEGAGNVSITAGEGKTVTFSGEKTCEGWTCLHLQRHP